MQKITLLLSFLLCTFAFSQSGAIYNITFTNYWNSGDHSVGTSFPGSNAHWSNLVGVNHNSNITFLELGGTGTATTGVENIAELGNQDVFQTVDVQNAIDANNAEQFINGGNLYLNAGTEINIDGLQISEDYPLLTLLSMIAPSPDWMMAVNSINLRSGGNWETSIVMDIFPYDAGTEDGSSYSLSNSATDPQGVITNISGVAPFNNQRVGQLIITLDSVLSKSDNISIESLKVYPNPTNGNITISNIQNIDLETIEIYNVLGKLVKQISVEQNLSQLKIDLSHFNKGIYLLKTCDGHRASHTQKLVIN